MENSIIDKIKKHPYIYFFVKLFIFLFIVFVIDFTVGGILNYFYFKQKSGYEFRTTYSIETTRADVLIFGSSRATRHYHPEIFEEQLDMTYYNVGRDGNFIFYHYAILKGILKRYTPKIIVLDFVNEEFKKNDESYDRLSTLLPYYETHPEIHAIIDLKSKYEKYKLVSKIYPFNSSVFKIAIANTDLNKKRSPDVKGFLPLKKVMDMPSINNSNSKNYEIDVNKVECYKNFIKDCNSAGIKLFIFVSPYYNKFSQTDYSAIMGESIAKEYNTKFFNYSNHTTYTNNNKLFADILHLNEEGAKLYSKEIIDKIIE